MPEKAFPHTHIGMIDALEFIEGAASSRGGSDVVDRAVLVAGEVLANAVEHGGEHPALMLHILVESTDHQLDMTICEPNHGVGIDQMDAAELPEDRLETSGRGLFLIRTLADAIQPTEGGTRYVFMVRDSS